MLDNNGKDRQTVGEDRQTIRQTEDKENQAYYTVVVEDRKKKRKKIQERTGGQSCIELESDDKQISIQTVDNRLTISQISEQDRRYSLPNNEIQAQTGNGRTGGADTRNW